MSGLYCVASGGARAQDEQINVSTGYCMIDAFTREKKIVCFGESGLLENEPTAPAEQAHTTQRQ